MSDGQQTSPGDYGYAQPFDEDGLPPSTWLWDRAWVRWALVGFGVAILLGAVLGVRAFVVRQPGYSADALVDAIAAGDSSGTAKYFDSRSVSRDFYDAGVEDLTASTVGEEFGWLTEEIAGLVEPAAVDLVEKEVVALLAHRDGILLWDESAVEVERSGDDAIVVVPIKSGGSARLLMVSRGEYWQVVGVENVDEVYPLVLQELVGQGAPQ